MFIIHSKNENREAKKEEKQNKEKVKKEKDNIKASCAGCQLKDGSQKNHSIFKIVITEEKEDEKCFLLMCRCCRCVCVCKTILVNGVNDRGHLFQTETMPTGTCQSGQVQNPAPSSYVYTALGNACSSDYFQRKFM